MPDKTESRRRVITVSAPADVDPSWVLFSEGIEVRPGDELISVETFGNADVQIETDEVR